MNPRRGSRPVECFGFTVNGDKLIQAVVLLAIIGAAVFLARLGTTVFAVYIGLRVSKLRFELAEGGYFGKQSFS